MVMLNLCQWEFALTRVVGRSGRVVVGLEVITAIDPWFESRHEEEWFLRTQSPFSECGSCKTIAVLNALRVHRRKSTNGWRAEPCTG